MTHYDVVIIGGGPAGLQAAISAATDGLHTAILEKSAGVGGQIGHTPRLENVAFVQNHTTGPVFAETMRYQAQRLGVKIITGVEVNSIRPPEIGPWFNVQSNIGSRQALFVVLALGKRWTDNDIEGMKKAQQKGNAFAGPVMCLRDEYAGKDVGVLGGGPAAAQAVLELAGKAKTVHVFVRSGMTAPLYLLDRMPGHQNIRVHEGFDVDEVSQLNKGVMVHAKDGHTQAVDCVFACNGLTADTDWLKRSRIRRTVEGQIETRLPSLETSVDNVFAVGDCRAGSVSRVGSAMGDGSNVVSEIWRKLSAMDDPKCANCERIFR